MTVSGDRAVLHPIAGTRRRGETAEQDAALAAELVSDPKEQAEHVMLVDLARNDLGRVVGRRARSRSSSSARSSGTATCGTSCRRSRRDVADGMDAFDVLTATFPAGTLTGAPKVRAMELIDELEPVRRNVYGGAVGYLDAAGDLDMAIAIRTAVMRDGKAYVQASAGIVADSVPENEEQETPQQGPRGAAGHRHGRDAAHRLVSAPAGRTSPLRRHAAVRRGLLLDLVGRGGALLVSAGPGSDHVARRDRCPTYVLDMTGRDVDSASTALALVALAGVVAVLATRGVVAPRGRASSSRWPASGWCGAASRRPAAVSAARARSFVASHRAAAPSTPASSRTSRCTRSGRCCRSWPGCSCSRPASPIAVRGAPLAGDVGAVRGNAGRADADPSRPRPARASRRRCGPRSTAARTRPRR